MENTPTLSVRIALAAYPQRKPYLMLLCAALLCACVNTKKLGVYKINPRQQLACFGEEFPSDAAPQRVHQRLFARVEPKIEDLDLEDTGAYLKVTPVLFLGRKFSGDLRCLDSVQAARAVARGISNSPKGYWVEIDKEYWYPGLSASTHKKPRHLRWYQPVNTFHYSGKRLLFTQVSTVLKAISVPAKVRFERGDRDATAEVGVDFGLGFGFKRTWKTFKNFYHCQNDKYLSYRIGEISAAAGLFASPIAQDLDPDNTDGGYSGERSALGFGIGAFGVFEISKVSLGLAAGIDHPLGKGAASWVYRDVPWLGVIIGLEFLGGDE